MNLSENKIPGIDQSQQRLAVKC